MSDSPKKEPSGFGGLRHRIRYRFDNLLARGTWATLLWLGVLTLGVVMVSALLLALFRVTLSGSQGSGFVEDLWQSVLRILDTGTMAADVGWGRRILALAITVFGVLIAGTIIGVIANGVAESVDRMKRGRSVVIESGHVVVLGDSERLPVLLYQLVLATSRRDNGAIVVLADRDPSELNDEIRREAAGRLGTRLVFRSGDPTVETDLEMVRLTEARSIIVLGDESQGDTRAMKTVMAAGTALGGFDEKSIVVELRDPSLGESLVAAWGPNVHPIIPAMAVTRAATFALRERGLGHVVVALTDLKDSDLQIRTEPDVVGLSFGEVVRRYAQARPLGRMFPDGQLQLNPQPDVTFEEGDRLIVIADERGPLALSAGSSTTGRDLATDGSAAFVESEEDHLLVVGWNHLGAAMLDDWIHFVTPGSSAEIVFDPEVIDPGDIVLGVTTSPRVDLTPTTAIPALPAHLRPEITTVVLLGYQGRLGADEADSRTLLDLVALRRHLAGRDGPAPRVITHLIDVDNLSLAGAQAVDDFVVSEAIGSQLIAQLAEQPERRPVMLELYRPGGVSIRLVPANRFGLTGEKRAREIFDEIYSSGLIAIGWRRSARRGGELSLNSHESHRVDLEPDDDIVVIG